MVHAQKCTISADVVKSIARCATVFISALTACALDIALSARPKRTTLFHDDFVARSTPFNTKGYSSTHLAMGFANVRAGTRYPPEH